jgi:subfamily B ATP-binding cassette protein MsbA
MQVLKKIIQITKPYWKRVFLGILLGLIVSGVTGAIAWLAKPVLDNVLVEKRYEYFALLALGIFLLFSIKGLLQFGYAYLMKSSAMKLVRDTQNRVHSHILYLRATYFHQETSGILISRVINDVRVLSTLFTEVIQTSIVQIPTILVLLGVAFYRKWDITLLTLLLFPLIAYSTRRFGKKVKKRSLEVQKRLSYLTHRLSETISGAKIIKVFNREDYIVEKFAEENQRFYRENMKVIKLKERTKLLIDVITGLAIGLILWYGGNQVKSGIITSGDFASIIAAIYMIFAPVKKLGDSYNFLQEIRSAIERIEAVLHAKREDSGTIEIQGLKDAIRYEHVSFAYEDTAVLKDINLEIKAGEVLAIVGRSGAGKTTFCDLIARFYDPTEGKISFDGIDIREINLKSLRELIGIVSQDIILFNDSISANIAFGNKNASFHDIQKAAEMAYASEFIEKLPEGYDTIIGERGMTLSGGQRQRLAIARAILKNPSLLILDEATSSLDTVSEALVQKALDELMKNRTTIVIAHRLSTIKNADRIVVLQDGKIDSVGAHEELLSKSPSYSVLYSDLIHESA